MNGLDFLDKINDIDDDLLVLEKPAKVTNLRRRTTIISLCAAAGVFLIIGSIILIPHFMNQGTSQISSVRTGGDGSGKKDSITDMQENGSAYEYEETTAAPTNETYSEDEDSYDEDSDAGASSDQDNQSSQQQQGDAQPGTTDKDSSGDSLYKGDVAIINNDKNITDGEGYDYLSEVSESISDSGVSFSDPISNGFDFSVDGFSFLDITDEPMIDVSYKYYIQYGDDSIISIVAITKNENDFKYQMFIYKWLDDLYEFLEEHEGEDVVFVRNGEDIYCIAPDNSCFSSKKDPYFLEQSDLYQTYKYDENTYHVG